MNPLIYKVLQVKFNTETNDTVEEKELIEAMQETYETCQFSTIPYFRHNTLSSAFTLKYYRSGNCIAMSMAVQQLLKKKYNVKSFLIPASIPKWLHQEGFLDISHIALCVPDKKGYYIIDTAFYFLQPLYISIDDLSKRKSGTSKNIMTSLKETVHYTGSQLSHDKIINAFQYIPEDTFICTTHFDHTPSDTWNYYIIEVLNPDDSIGRAFLHIRQDNFITVTDKFCNIVLYIKQSRQFKDDIIIKYKKKELFNGLLDTIGNSLLSYLNKQFNLFIPYGLINALM